MCSSDASKWWSSTLYVRVKKALINISYKQIVSADSLTHLLHHHQTASNREQMYGSSRQVKKLESITL